MNEINAGITYLQIMHNLGVANVLVRRLAGRLCLESFNVQAAI